GFHSPAMNAMYATHLMSEAGEILKNAATSMIEAQPGVCTSSGDPPLVGAISRTGSRREVAFSKFAAYLQMGQLAIRSSPASVYTMNSCDCEPPIAPESASTATNLSPQRVKMTRYAASCRSKLLSRPAASMSKEYASFMMNWRTRSRPDLGRGSSRNLV